MSDPIKQMLDFDPLSAAERITGESYKCDDETMKLGFGLHLVHNERKAAALRQTDDSWFGMDLADTLALHDDLGFEEVLRHPFVGTDGREEAYFIFWHRDGILATVESYNTTGRNNSKMYYNFEFTGTEDRWSYTSSGGMVTDSLWAGNHDTREGMRNTLDRFRSVGHFLPVWVERPFLWLLTYMDTKGDYDYDAINAERISQLPQHVQAALA